MSIKKLVACLLFGFCSVYASDDVQPFSNPKEFVKAVSDYRGEVGRAKHAIQMTSTEVADTERLSRNLGNIWERFNKTPNKQQFFTDVRRNIADPESSLKKAEIFDNWYVEQLGEIKQIAEAQQQSGRVRSVSTASSSSSPRSDAKSPRLPQDAMSPGRRRGVTGGGAQAMGRQGYIVSSSTTPEKGGETTTKIFGGTGLPPKPTSPKPAKK
jgi:hypothetical protein